MMSTRGNTKAATLHRQYMSSVCLCLLPVCLCLQTVFYLLVTMSILKCDFFECLLIMSKSGCIIFLFNEYFATKANMIKDHGAFLER